MLADKKYAKMTAISPAWWQRKRVIQWGWRRAGFSIASLVAGMNKHKSVFGFVAFIASTHQKIQLYLIRTPSHLPSIHHHPPPGDWVFGNKRSQRMCVFGHKSEYYAYAPSSAQGTRPVRSRKKKKAQNWHFLYIIMENFVGNAFKTCHLISAEGLGKRSLLQPLWGNKYFRK